MPGEANPERLTLERAARGDRDAARDFVRAHQQAVFRFAARLLRDEAAAEDVTQETLLSALRAAGDFRGGSVRGWLLTIARNASISRRRRRVGEPAVFEPLDELGREAGWGDDGPEEALARTERRDLLERSLRALEDDDREVIWLRDVEGLSGDETAQALGCSRAAMKSRLHRARLRLAAEVRRGVRHGTGS